MKGLMVNFITKQADGFIGSNAFSVGIDATKVLRYSMIFKCYQAITKGSYPNHLVYVQVISKKDPQDCPK